MALVKVEIFKSTTFSAGGGESQRVAIQADMNTFLTSIAPADVLQLDLNYVIDGKNSANYAYVGSITYLVL